MDSWGNAQVASVKEYENCVIFFTKALYMSVDLYETINPLLTLVSWLFFFSHPIGIKKPFQVKRRKQIGFAFKLQYNAIENAAIYIFLIMIFKKCDPTSLNLQEIKERRLWALWEEAFPMVVSRSTKKQNLTHFKISMQLY